jgi:small GTP-binding protein
MSNLNKTIRILVIGDSSVGKTTIINRLTTHKNFSDIDHMPTIGVDFHTFQTRIDGDNIRINIWDVSGSDKFRSIISGYYKNINGIIMVYDISNPKSFNNIEKWLNDIKLNVTNPLIKILLIGNKIDLRNANYLNLNNLNNLKIDTNNGIDLAKKNGLLFNEISAKDIEIENLIRIFNRLLMLVYNIDFIKNIHYSNVEKIETKLDCNLCCSLL